MLPTTTAEICWNIHTVTVLHVWMCNTSYLIKKIKKRLDGSTQQSVQQLMSITLFNQSKLWDTREQSVRSLGTLTELCAMTTWSVDDLSFGNNFHGCHCYLKLVSTNALCRALLPVFVLHLVEENSAGRWSVLHAPSELPASDSTCRRRETQSGMVHTSQAKTVARIK